MIKMYRLIESTTRERVNLLQRVSSTLQRTIGATSTTGDCSGALGSEALTTLDQTFRQQHQLSSPNHEHREAMRLFLDSLNYALTNPSSKLAVPAPKFPRKVTLPKPQERQKEEAKFSQLSNTIEEKSEPAGIKKPKRKAPFTPNNSDVNVLLGRAIRRNDARKALSLFRSALENNTLVDTKSVVSLFYLVSKRDPIPAFEILAYYNLHPETTDMRIDMYRRLCISVALLDPRTARHAEIRKFVESLLTELDRMEDDIKQELYPILVASLVTQRSVTVGPYAGLLYNYMVSKEFKMTPGWLNKLLAASKYNRQEDLPFADVLARLVSIGGFPHPLSTFPVIHNMFPYTDSSQMRVALQALLEIQEKVQEEGNEETASLYRQYVIDLGTLEMISAGAAHSGDPELILLVWEALEKADYTPTEQIYENTIIAFACRKDGLFQAFAALVSMKEEGFEVSRAVIRSFSKAIRSKRWRVDKALHLLIQEDSGDLQCLENFNVVMSSYAERGDVNETIGILDTIRQHGFKPNQDSYSYSMEVLGKDLHRRKTAKDRACVHKNIELASSLLTRMEEEGVAPSADAVRNYVELLCMGNELETATALVQDCLSSDEMVSIVNNKTLYRVALSNADAGNIEIAKMLAAKTSEEFPILDRKIRSKEQRFNHLENMRVMREREKSS